MCPGGLMYELFYLLCFWGCEGVLVHIMVVCHASCNCSMGPDALGPSCSGRQVQQAPASYTGP